MMPSKDYEPIKFEIFQSDMEKILYQLQMAINGKMDVEQLKRINIDLLHKVEIHKHRGEWK